MRQALLPFCVTRRCLSFRTLFRALPPYINADGHAGGAFDLLERRCLETS
jgi:hypothetical protein